MYMSEYWGHPCSTLVAIPATKKLYFTRKPCKIFLRDRFLNEDNVLRKWKRDFENSYYISLKDEQHSRWIVDSLIVDNFCSACEILEADDHFTLDEIVACMSPVGSG